MYIISTESSFEPTDSPGVMPVESPTVANALTTSVTISRRGISGSIRALKNVPVSTTEMPIAVITAALRKALFGTE